MQGSRMAYMKPFSQKYLKYSSFICYAFSRSIYSLYGCGVGNEWKIINIKFSDRCSLVFKPIWYRLIRVCEAI